MYAGIMQSWFSLYCKNSLTENTMKYLQSNDGYIYILVFADPFLAQNQREGNKEVTQIWKRGVTQGALASWWFVASV